MRISFSVPFSCPTELAPHLQKVLSGEYDVPFPFESPQILDLGANCGAFSLWASHRWPDCKIYAYEPDAANFEILCRNIAHYPHVLPIQRAIGTPGLRVFLDGAHNSGEGSFYRMSDNDRLTGRHLEVMSPLILPRADIIKIDTEGCELEILRPLIEDGRTFSAILLEYHSESDRREIDSLLRDYCLVGSIVEYVGGRGVCRYVHQSLMKEIL